VQPSDRRHNNAPEHDDDREDRRVARAFLWIGIGIGVVGIGAAVAYTVVQMVARANRVPDDPTSQRIQQLIDEANSLLKTLDEQKNSA